MANKIVLTKDYLEVQCDRNDTAVQEFMCSLFPVHSNRIKTVYRTTLFNLEAVLKALRGIDESNIYTAPIAVVNQFYKSRMEVSQVTDLIVNGPVNSPVVNEHLTLRRHQQLGREIANYMNRFAFFYDTRTGKTPLSLAIMYDDIMKHPDHKWLVVCPLILIENAWMPDAAEFVPELSIISCHDITPAKRLKRLATAANIYVTNTESFVRYREHFDNMGFTGCFIDESSDMKSPKSKVSKELVDFAQTVQRFYLLSGTPAPNGEYEYYMQLKAVDFYGIQASYTQFKEYFFVNTSYNPQFEKLMLRPDRKATLFDVIRRKALYVDKEDVLTTPGRSFIEVEFEMPAELKKHYNKLKNELYIEVKNDVTITAPSAATKLNKLNQVTSGFVIDTQAVKENKFYEDNNATEWYLLDYFRFDKLLELLNSDGIKGEQVLIWANYRTEFELIQKALGDKCRCVYGGTTITEKNEAIKLFKQGKVQYLIANPASADKGLTLTNAHISIYFSLNWSYELFKQSMERIYGDVSKQPNFCNYYVMIAKGTIDRVLYSDVLLGKGTASHAVLDHLKGSV